MRITRNQMFMMMAYASSLRSTCNRLKVGAILANENRPISMGYNGSPSGLPHCNQDCGPDNPCRNTIHAEYNAIHWALVTLGTIPPGCTLYVTHAPCPTCSLLIRGAGVKKVVYGKEFRNMWGIESLKKAGVEIELCPVVTV